MVSLIFRKKIIFGIFTLVAVLFLIFLDRISKIFILKYLSTDKNLILINNWLSLIKVSNTGAAFGILKSHTEFLTIFSVFILIILIFYLIKTFKSSNLLKIIGFIMIISGAAGNLWDRIVFGHIIDFIKFDFIDFPVFNFADVFINLGAVLIIIYMILNVKKYDKQ